MKSHCICVNLQKNTILHLDTLLLHFFSEPYLLLGRLFDVMGTEMTPTSLLNTASLLEELIGAPRALPNYSSTKQKKKFESQIGMVPKF